jgi:adenosylmethionine-8-amino-7-oxononanoate aminotransferase
LGWKVIFGGFVTISLSSIWVQRSLDSVWHPCTQMQHHETMPLIPIQRGKGVWLYDVNGKAYLDAISSWWVNLFGHAHPKINGAIKEQLDTLEHVMLAGCTHLPVIELSERLSQLTQSHLGHCFYASDGASAVEIALKMSFHAWQNQGRTEKKEFICLKGSYHGETLGALGVTDVPVFREVYHALLTRAHVIEGPDNRKINVEKTAVQIAKEAGEKLELFLKEHHTKIAAFIIEPLVQCATGMVIYDPEYIRIARRLCDEYEVHLIADEIAVGCGRTGTFFACEQAQVWPDFLCLSKGISGGYLPLSLVMTKEEIYQQFYHSHIRYGFLHSHSYTGNPLACRAALATLSLFEEENVLQQNRVRADYITRAFHKIVQHENVQHFRQCGMIWAFDVTLTEPVLRESFSKRFFIAALEEGILLRPIGCTVYIMPPYIIQEEEIDQLMRGIKSALFKVTTQ